MPESAQSTSRKRTASYPLAMESPIDVELDVSFESVKDVDGSNDLGRSERTMSVESLNTLLSRMPEISIPATLYNPLPLQCLAANALPEGVKAEIDGVIAQYSGSPDTLEQTDSHCTINECADSIADEGSSALDKDIDTLTAALHRALGIEELVSPTSVNKPVVPVYKKTIQRELDVESCSGMCVVEWNGQLLEECTYEEVQKIMCSIDATVYEVEISVMKCSENLLISRGGFDWLPSFAAVRLNKRRNAVFEYKRDSDCKSTISDDSSEPSTIPSSPSHRLSHSREHLDLPLADSPPLNQRRRSTRSTSPSEPKKSLTVTIPKSDETTQALLASLEARPKSPKRGSLNDIMNKLPNGMVQLCLGYNKEYEELNISLLQVKALSSKEFSDISEVFINTYLVPDYRDQGVRSIMSGQARKESTEYHNTSYMMAPDEVQSVALRVILWDAHKAKNIMFRGEVLLGLSDEQVVNLVSVPTWYTLCPEDPNLSKLPTPIHYKHRNNLLHKIKQKAHSLTTTKPLLKTSTSLSSDLKPSTSMLSLPGSIEQRSMTLLRKKQRKESRKTHSGSFTPQVVDYMLQPETMPKSCLKEPCRQQKLSSILNVLRESREDLSESPSPEVESTDGPFQDHRFGNQAFSTLDRRPRSKSATPETHRLSFPNKTTRKESPMNRNENGGSSNFLEELEKLMSQQNFGLQPVPGTRGEKIDQEEQAHYKLVDTCQSEDEPDSPPKTTRGSIVKSNDFVSYPVEVSMHRINVEDVDKKEQAKKKSCTLPVERSSAPRPKTLLPVRADSDKRPPKPPKTYRSKSVGDIEKLGSEEELFIVRSHHYSPDSVPADCRYDRTLGSIDHLDSVEPVYDGNEELTSLDFGNRQKSFGSCDFLDGVDNDRDTLSVGHREPEGRKKSLLDKSKWKSLEDLLGGSKSKRSKTKTTRKLSAQTPTQPGTYRKNSSQENGVAGNVKLEFEFNDLNRAHPVLLVKMTDVVLSSTKLLSTDLLMKCYLTHISTGVCILKDKTSISLKSNTNSAPLGIVQFGTDIANLAVQVLLCTGTKKMFARKIIGQVTVDLAALDLSGGKTFSQWFLLSKPTQAV